MVIPTFGCLLLNSAIPSFILRRFLKTFVRPCSFLGLLLRSLAFAISLWAWVSINVGICYWALQTGWKCWPETEVRSSRSHTVPEGPSPVVVGFFTVSCLRLQPHLYPWRLSLHSLCLALLVGHASGLPLLRSQHSMLGSGMVERSARRCSFELCSSY